MRMPLVSYFVVMGATLTLALIFISNRIEPLGSPVPTSQIVGLARPYMGKHDILVKLDKLKFVDEPVKTSTTSTAPTGTTGSAATRPATSPSASASTSTKNKWYPDHAVMSGATKESLKNMSEFKFD